jgi:hypothetical protein
VTPETALSLLGGATGTAMLVAVAKHMPDWPITWKGIYDWFKGSVQEIAAQRSGGVVNGNPQPPADPAKK